MDGVRFSGDTWHATIEDAIAQAQFEFGLKRSDSSKCPKESVLGYEERDDVVACWELEEIAGQVARLNQCTGSWEFISVPADAHNQLLQPTAPTNGAAAE